MDTSFGQLRLQNFSKIFSIDPSRLNKSVYDILAEFLLELSLISFFLSFTVFFIETKATLIISKNKC